MASHTSSHYSSLLACNWISIEVQDPTTLSILLPDMHCTDMTGCIRFAQQLMPEVEIIHTTSEMGSGTSYFKRVTGWQAETSWEGKRDKRLGDIVAFSHFQ